MESKPIKRQYTNPNGTIFDKLSSANTVKNRKGNVDFIL